MARLPSELWNDILEYSTFVFGELEERIYDPFCCPPAQVLELAIKESNISRYNFIHVSGAFYTHSIPYLYRTIVVNSPISWKNMGECLTINKRRVCDQLDTPLNSSFIRSIHFLTTWPFHLNREGIIDLPNLTIYRSAKASILAYKSGVYHPLCTRFNMPQLRVLEGSFANASDCLHTAVHFPSSTSCFATTLPSIPPFF